MAIRLRRPTEESLGDLLSVSRSASVTYKPTGVTTQHAAPSGYRRDEWSASLGRGDGVFASAVHALMTWQVHREAGLTFAADSDVAVGATVAMSAPLPLGHVDITCRVVAVEVSPNSTGFRYGTLRIHPEQGEEAFLVRIGEDQEVTFEIVAVSRPRHPLARLFPFVARPLQRKATERYLAAMKTVSQR